MTESPHPAGITVFLTDGGPIEAGIRRLVGDWCAGGLVDGSVWLTSEAWKATNGRLEEAKAELVGPDDGPTSLLVDLLSDLPLDILRIVVVHIATDERPGDPALTRLANQFAQRLRVHLPHDTALRVVNLIVPTSQAVGIPRSVLLESQHAMSVNVIVSPEDRLTDAHISVGVRDGDGGNLEGHAALAAATAGTLWSGMDVGPFDERRNPSLAGEHLVVARTFAGAVHVEPLIDAVSTQALRPREEWPIPDSGSVTAPIPALDPVRLTARVVDQCVSMADGALRYRPYQPPPGPEPKSIGILQAFGELFRFLYQRLRRLPREMGARLRYAAVDQAERLAQAMTYGDGSSMAVRSGVKPAAEQRMSIGSLVNDASHVLQVTGALAETYNAPSPELWRSLRGVAFSLVDGSELPADFEVPQAGDRRQIVTDVRHIAPDPYDAERPAVEAAVAKALQACSLKLPSGDPWAARRAQQALQARLAAVGADEELSEDQRSARTIQLRDALDKLTAWMERQRPALLWQVGDAVSRQVEQAEDDLSQALENLGRRSLDDNTALRKAWRRCRNWWITITIITALAINGSWQAELSRPVTWEATVGYATVGFLLIVFAFLRYARIEFQTLWRHQRNHYLVEVAYETALQSAREIVRLGGLYVQLADWAEIVGGVVRRPWGIPAQGDAQQPVPRQTGLPKALVLAEGRTSDDQRTALAAGASRDLFTLGWLSDAFDRFSAEALDRFAVQHALPSSPDPDLDTPQAPTFVRDHLRRAVKEPERGAEAFRRGRNLVASYLSQQPPDCLVNEVFPLGDATGHPVSPREFFARTVPSAPTGYLLAEIWTDRAVASEAHRVDTTRLWSADEASQGGAEHHPMREVELIGGGLSLKSVRLDCSGPCTSAGLRLFVEDTAPLPHRPATVDDDGD